ncbi:hypothetical protein FOZ60_007737 [Perkinsus olseni]|uniref:Pinin/SDK/MemA protein domain-containing protein n=1 Tax=Perkinsus olseni TaxID=32597 RepID=A0A7J6NKW1_PEROL|nr:hypothetical protein FOZ60_007737 [Perkinsus olseni]
MSTSTANKPAAPRGGRKDAFFLDLPSESARIQERLAETKPPPVDSNEVGGIVDYDQDDDGAGGDSGEPTADGRAGRQQSQPRQSEELTEEQREKEAKARFIKSELGGFSEASPQIRESMKRNRRMFGNLLGHLGSAKQRLEKGQKERCGSTPGGVRSEGRGKASEAAQQSERNQTSRMGGEEEARSRTAGTMEQVLKEMEAKKIELLKIRLQSHYKQMTGFIRTNAQPSVFYLPKHHNSESKELLEQTKQQIEQKIASIPYSFAEFGEPTVASAGDVEEEKEAAGTSIRSLGVPGTIEVSSSKPLSVEYPQEIFSVTQEISEGVTITLEVSRPIEKEA